jgi:hypothetical protein
MIDDEDEIAAITHANHINAETHEVVMKVVSMDVKRGL